MTPELSMGAMKPTLRKIGAELKLHAPFTAIGTLTGVAIVAFVIWGRVPSEVSRSLFWLFHPLHVFLSALTTVAVYCRHGERQWWRVLLIGYFGAIGVATLSDCILPFVGEVLLDLPNRGIHFGFIEKWWLVNPLALAGIVVGARWRRSKVSHAGHVLLSTWASLFHMTMAFGAEVSSFVTLWVAVFLFLSVWVPCCTSDIVFPLLFAKPENKHRGSNRTMTRRTYPTS